MNIFNAVENGDLSKVKELIEKVADVNARDYWENTTLYGVRRWGYSEIVKHLESKGETK
jgi:ferric iron reductase protein FhuF